MYKSGGFTLESGGLLTSWADLQHSISLQIRAQQTTHTADIRVTLYQGTTFWAVRRMFWEVSLWWSLPARQHLLIRALFSCRLCQFFACDTACQSTLIAACSVQKPFCCTTADLLTSLPCCSSADSAMVSLHHDHRCLKHCMHVGSLNL